MHRPQFAADADAAAHVIVPALADEVRVTGDDGHHLARVRRLRAGEMVTAADGSGRWRLYAVADSGRAELRLVAHGLENREPAMLPRVVVAFALTKGTKPELVVQKVTELGADAIRPVQSTRSVRRPVDRRRLAGITERLRRIAREAAAQSRRARVPEVAPVAELWSLADAPSLVVAARDGRPPESLTDPVGDEWTLVIGPEGGFTVDELARLGDPPRLAVGPHVLRAETAAIATVAALAGRRHPA